MLYKKIKYVLFYHINKNKITEPIIYSLQSL